MTDTVHTRSATIRWTSGEMYTEDQGNGDSCWVLFSDYDALQDVTIDAQHSLITALTKIERYRAAVEALRQQAGKCAFVDDHGHELSMNKAFQDLLVIDALTDDLSVAQSEGK